VLRLFALSGNWETYEKPMLRYLNQQMNENKEFSSARAEEFKGRFPAVVQLVNEALKSPFRPRGVINSAVLEAVMVTLLEHADITAEQLAERYKKLLETQRFLDLTRGSTTDTGILRNRLELARTVLTDAPG
jgi:hypothetical protein